MSEDSAGSQSLVTILDPTSCEVTSSLTGVPGDVRGVAFDQSGENLALGTEDNGAGVWDVATGELLTRIGDETETVRALAFGNGETLGWATTDGKLHVTDIADPELSQQDFLVHGGDEIVTLAFSAVDDAFLSGAATGEMRRVKPDGASPVGPAFRALAPLDYSGESFRPRGLAANGPGACPSIQRAASSCGGWTVGPRLAPSWPAIVSWSWSHLRPMDRSSHPTARRSGASTPPRANGAPWPTETELRS